MLVLDEVLSHLQRMHERTARVARLIPPAAIEHTFRPGRFTLGDLVRHLAGINRYMFIETAAGRPNRYPGHHEGLASGLDAVLDYHRRLHQEGMAVLRSLTPVDLDRKCQTPAGVPMAVWKWLRAMAEHEAHHRGQLYWMLADLGISTPPLFGLTSEEVLDRAAQS